jgi:UPF0755 protein
MTDLYDQDTPAPTAERRGPRPGLLLLALVLVTVIGAVLVVGGGYLVTRAFGGSGTADYVGNGTGLVTVQVSEGDSASAIGRTLSSAGVVKSAKAFTNAAGDDSRSSGIQPGFYRLRRQMKGTSALALLLEPASKVRSRVIIPEGLPLVQTLSRIAEQSEIPLADLQAAARQPAAIGVPAAAQGRVEGFLFPATYEFGPDATAVQALSAMTRRFGDAAQDVGLDLGAKAISRTPLQVVIIASLLEREGKTVEEFGKISRVISNRLARRMPLGLESTLRYALGGADQTRLVQSQIDRARQSPYDTYRRVGLPPGPIGNPGEAALKAALAPTPGDWLYFVTLPKEDRSVFTNSEREFNQLVARCRAQGGC